MKHSFVVILFLCFSSFAFSQSDLKNAPYTKFISKPNGDAFLISTKPVTNREYIIYLLWLYHVYYADYPANFVEAFPGIPKELNSAYFPDSGDSIFSYFIKNTDSFVKDYMFNPKYIDYPVIGISSLQAKRFCKWLSDRSNEYRLIKYGYYELPDTARFQINEDCFTTESYLAGQYYGYRTEAKKDIDVTWSDRILLPAFHLPTSAELKAGLAGKNISQAIKPYPYDTSSFINSWQKMYLDVTSSVLILKYGTMFQKTNDRDSIIYYFAEAKEMITQAANNFSPNNLNCQEYTLEQNGGESLSLVDAFEKAGQPVISIKDYDFEKDSLGRMQYIIIDEDINKKPVAVKLFPDSSPFAPSSEFKIFRYSCSIRKNQYKP